MARARETTRVLHVIESFATGSLSALMQYVGSTPDLEHHLLRRIKAGEYVDDGEAAGFASVHELPASNATCPAAVRRTVREVQPDVVHAHSSLAGLFVRTAIRTRAGRRIVYTPHCFAFERADVSGLARVAYRAAEWTLALNTSAVAGCSAREAELARRWRSCRRALHVPNHAGALGDVTPAADGRPASVPTVVACGRLSSQKDPEFFRRFVLELRGAGAPFRALWIGSGDTDSSERLRDSGIDVTGWLPRSAAVARLAGAALYVHTARWEGFPVALLEAHELRLPVLARRIPALAHLPPDLLADDPQQLAAKAERLLRVDVAARRSNVAQWDEALAENTPELQRTRLREAYRRG